MEQVPHWLAVTVFAAGMTAYAEEVSPQAPEIKADVPDSGASPEHDPEFH